MNKVLIAGGLGAALILAGIFLVSGSGEDAMKKDAAMKADDSAMEKKDSGAMMEDKKMENESMMPKDDSMVNKTDTTMKEETSMNKGETMMAKGSYEPYASAKLSMADAGDVVLFFRASWCPTCKTVDADIRAKKDSIPGGLTILDVDYDNSADLKKKYGVTYQHTFVQVDSKGNLIKKWAGSPTLTAIVAEVQ